MNDSIRRLLGIFVIAALLAPHSLFAARMMIDPPMDTYLMGDTFVIPVRVDGEGVCINTIENTIQYDATKMTAIDVGRGSSILTLWAEQPHIDKDRGVISFSGGVPGGYCGRVLGDPGQTNIVAELVFTANGDIPDGGASTTISLARSQIFEHDGRGTLLPTTNSNATISLIRSTSSRQTNEWLTLVRNDVIAPELFDVVLSQSDSVVGGKWFIVFSTVDKQSGVDHYEVLETDPDRFGLLAWISKKSAWIVADSPYVLRDQKLQSKILVKAVDKNGNERIVTYIPPEQLVHRNRVADSIYALVFGGIIIVLVLLAYGYYRKSKPRARKSNNTNRGHTDESSDNDTSPNDADHEVTS